ncbi:MAG TPA: hybrid sensor histidine kinase/response regulator [Gemmataceae bacterium]|jgi:signal transduction histidine kinase|nr:hybrid sensor histidine kinase/response regulator [Gemmataceae bacterium]
MVARHCLLIVDDEPEVVHSLQDLLRFDYRVLGTTRAAEGLKLLDRENVHIVMSDQRMPEMSGVEFLQRMRDTHPDVVRLLFTGYADIKAVIDAINQGHVFRYITKPWDADELQTVLRQAAERFDLFAERKQLLAELQEKNCQLEAMNAELRQASNLKEAFIKVASHELRTPLTIVLGLADLARQTDGVGEPLHNWLEQIYHGSQRLNRLIEQITRVLVAGRFERTLARADVSVANLVRTAANDMVPFAVQRHQTLEVDAPPELGVMALDADKLRDSVAHLILNAIKFTPDGGTIRVAGRRLPDGGVELTVTDTGMGMDRACVERLFQPFFTGFDVSRHRSGVFEYDRRGLGLGLSLVRAFVEMHGGKVSATSEVGRGSTFTIALPTQPSQGGNGKD